MPDKLAAHLKPIYDRFQNRRLHNREDAFLCFVREIKRVTKDEKWSTLYRKIYDYTNNPDHRGTAFNTAILEVERWMHEIEIEQN